LVYIYIYINEQTTSLTCGGSGGIDDDDDDEATAFSVLTKKIILHGACRLQTVIPGHTKKIILHGACRLQSAIQQSNLLPRRHYAAAKLLAT
jgi:hypothetical protein